MCILPTQVTYHSDFHCMICVKTTTTTTKKQNKNNKKFNLRDKLFWLTMEERIQEDIKKQKTLVQDYTHNNNIHAQKQKQEE